MAQTYTHEGFGSLRDDGCCATEVPRHSRPRPRLAVLYSGRLFAPEQTWAANHLENIIRPNDASVFVAVDPTNWCATSEVVREAYARGDDATVDAAFQAQVRAVFQGWPKLHALLTGSEDPGTPHLYGGMGFELWRRQGEAKASGRVGTFLHKWFMQFDHYARAEGLRQAFGPHELVLRMRLDVELQRPMLVKAARDGAW